MLGVAFQFYAATPSVTVTSMLHVSGQSCGQTTRTVSKVVLMEMFLKLGLVMLL